MKSKTILAAKTPTKIKMINNPYPIPVQPPIKMESIKAIVHKITMALIMVQVIFVAFLGIVLVKIKCNKTRVLAQMRLKIRKLTISIELKSPHKFIDILMGLLRCFPHLYPSYINNDQEIAWQTFY